jgi:pimeloyl-ACP methyl ester carboxylesterase
MSTLPMDKLPQGAPYAIGAAVVQTLRTAPELVGAVVLDNPRRASDLSEGERIVFFEDQSDRQRDNPAQVQHRTYSFAVGVVNRSTNARQAAHADYRAAKRAIRTLAMTAMTQAGVEVNGGGLREGEVRYRLENIDVGGELVLGVFTLDYRDPN